MLISISFDYPTLRAIFTDHSTLQFHNEHIDSNFSHPTLSAKEKMLLASSQWNIYKNEIAEAMEAAAK